MTDDLISRQAAIDFIAAGHLVNPNEPRWSDNEVVNFLKSRPSAQPEKCEDCGNFNKARLLIPQPERKKGKWQITDAYPHNVYCSECHKKFAQTHWAVWEDGSLPRNFCPNCGAKMQEEQK